jgi:hypothetical protein
MDTNQDYILQDASLDSKSDDNFNQNPFSISSDVCWQMGRHDLPIMRSCCALHEEELPLAPVATLPTRASAETSTSDVTDLVALPAA